MHHNIHPVANIFPEISEEELKILADDIKKHGLREPIILYDEKIIDGRSRYAACKIAAVSPRFRIWEGNSSLVDYVLSLNLHRRHLTPGQKAAIAAEALPHYEAEAKERQRLSQGKGVKVLQDCSTLKGESAEHAAHAIGASPRNVYEIKKIKAANPNLHQKIKEGKLSIPAAKRRLSNKENLKRHENLAKIKPQKTKLEDGKEKFKPFLEIARRACDLAAEIDALLETAKKDAPCLSVADVVSHLKMAASTIRLNQPHAVCPYCQGDGTDKVCGGTGWANKTIFDNAPRELTGKAHN
jgi:ParB-like chromosome segregation protein Spo0J